MVPAVSSSRMTIELYPTAPLEGDTPGQKGRSIFGDGTGAWQLPVLGEWELTGADFTDQHPHDEFNVVLEGELHVEADGVLVVAGPGDMVRVVAGCRARYFAPVHARMLFVYGPNPDGAESIIVGGGLLSSPPP